MIARFDYKIRGMKEKYKAIHVFSVGMLCGVIVTAAVAFGLAIPGNSDYWRMEIWKRGGAAWTSDKNGHLSWKWLVEPVPTTPRKEPLVMPSSQTKVRTEKL
jgi:hypothetical protein